MATKRTSRTQTAIRARGLTKFYGKTRGIEQLDLTVERGEVFGFLGPNGAGKSTTINLLMGFRRPTSGTATVLGRPAGPDATGVRRQIGYMPGELSLYGNLRARDLLDYFARLRGGVDPAYVRELADRLALDTGKRIKDLSKGNKQKVALVQAWMHRPDLLILDEPTSGLDPLVQQEFHGLVKESARRGTTVFMSSHVLSEVERICDRAAIIKDGRLVSLERIATLHRTALRHVEVVFAKRPAANVLAAVPGVTNRRLDKRTLRCNVHGPIDPLLKALARHRLENVVIEPASLEELFFQEYGEEADG